MFLCLSPLATSPWFVFNSEVRSQQGPLSRLVLLSVWSYLGPLETGYSPWGRGPGISLLCPQTQQFKNLGLFLGIPLELSSSRVPLLCLVVSLGFLSSGSTLFFISVWKGAEV